MKNAGTMGSGFHQPPPFNNSLRSGKSCENPTKGGEETIHPNKWQGDVQYDTEGILVNSYD
jgi:hypothetical protein